MRVRLAVFALLAIGFIVLAGLNLQMAIGPRTTPPCRLDPYPLDFGAVSRGWYVVGTVIFLTLGRLLGRRHGSPMFETVAIAQESSNAPTVSGDLEPGPHRLIRLGAVNSWRTVVQANVVQLLVFVLVSVAIAGLGYETWGVANHNHPWPLTFFVKCLNETSSQTTFLTTMAIAFVIGTWFWPERSTSTSPRMLASPPPGQMES